MHLDDECPHEEHQKGDEHEGGEGTHGCDDDSDEAMIRFLTRRGCPLCDEAYALVESLTATSDINVEVVDIDLDLELLDLYDERVPVLLDSEGTVIAEGQMTERETARVLRD